MCCEIRFGFKTVEVLGSTVDDHLGMLEKVAPFLPQERLEASESNARTLLSEYESGLEVIGRALGFAELLPMTEEMKELYLAAKEIYNEIRLDRGEVLVYHGIISQELKRRMERR